MLPLEKRDHYEAYDHEAYAYGCPGLGHAAYPELVFGGGPVGAHDVGARGIPLPRLETLGVLYERGTDGLVGGEFGPQAIDLPGEPGDAVGPLRAGPVEVGSATHRREP